jgi:hypothetical protein
VERRPGQPLPPMDSCRGVSDSSSTVRGPDDVEALMCQLCDQHRFAIQAVGGSRCRAEFRYTVGLTAHGLPELVVTGVRVADAGRLLRHWGDCSRK